MRSFFLSFGILSCLAVDEAMHFTLAHW